MIKSGALIISLDLELCWGVIAGSGLDKNKKNILGAGKSVPAILELFENYGIHATWATVGFLFLNGKDELNSTLPLSLPDYKNKKLFSYYETKNIGRDEKEDLVHIAPSLIKKIVSYPGQEIGTHTFSHYYCLEDGQNINNFRDDLVAAVEIAKKYDLKIESIIFPKNQINQKYLPVCKELGIRSYRGNPRSAIYKSRKSGGDKFFIRLLRLADAYLNITGHNAYSIESINKNFPYNISASRFLRSYSDRLSIFESLKLRRILSDMDNAAKNNLIYHLWWHPCDFGANTGKNLLFLKKIFDRFVFLKNKYGMESLNMKELTGIVSQN